MMSVAYHMFFYIYTLKKLLKEVLVNFFASTVQNSHCFLFLNNIFFWLDRDEENDSGVPIDVMGPMRSNLGIVHLQ